MVWGAWLGEHFHRQKSLVQPTKFLSRRTTKRPRPEQSMHQMLGVARMMSEAYGSLTTKAEREASAAKGKPRG
jgi:hypothetical protein